MCCTDAKITVHTPLQRGEACRVLCRSQFKADRASGASIANGHGGDGSAYSMTG